MKTNTLIFTALFSAIIAWFTVSLHADTYTLDKTFGQVPLVFTPNEGQFDAPVKFAVEGNNLNALNDFENIGFIFKDINHAAEITVDDHVSWNNNYFIGNDPGNWHTDVPNYKHVRIHDIYDGIDLTCTSNDRRIDFEVLIQPHADPLQIVFGGTDYYNNSFYRKFYFNEQDELVGIRLNTTTDVYITEQPPYCFQLINGKEIPVEVMFTITDDGQTVGYEFGDYDPDYELVIRPELVDSALWILKNTMGVSGIDVDDSGNLYVAGNVSFYDFSSLFVLKLKETGDVPEFTTYIGGKLHTSGRIPTPKDIAVDNSGNSYITGERVSSDFPVTENAYDKTLDTAKLFVLKLSNTGNSLNYSTFLGGNGIDHVSSIAVDINGFAYLTGLTCSEDFPITENAYDTSLSGQNCKCYVTKFNHDGTSLIYSTFIDVSTCEDLVVNEYGETYITGRNLGKVFVAKINSEGNNYIFENTLDGTENAYSNSLFIDSLGYIYITGSTSSEDFPITENALDNSFNGGDNDCFITQLNQEGSKILYSSFLGGGQYEYTDGVIVDTAGNIYISGYTRSSDFPITDNAYKKIYDGDWEPFLFKYRIDSNKLIYSSFLGGSSSDINDGGFALYENGSFIIAGRTQSTDFPILNGIFDTGYYNIIVNENQFILKLSLENETYVQYQNENPRNIVLNPPYPNPFNSSITINYIIPESTIVELSIYSITGQKVATLVDKYDSAGNHSITYDASHFASGIYICFLKSGNIKKFRKAILLK